MATFVALLRAVNVAGHQPVGMADLRSWLGALGFTAARTLLQSGNLLFDGVAASGGALERRLEREAKRSLDLETDIFVRTAAEWEKIVARNPFPAEAERDPQRLVLIVLREEVGAAAVRALQTAIVGRETIRGDGKQLYVVYPDGQGRSRLTAAFIEKQLGTRCTARNWNTVLRIAAAATTYIR
jgi:uncharacterized protein (DUF1697 family)